jgi:hypothetical protein
MEARPLQHPSRDDLAAPASGTLDEAAAVRLFAHLEGCPECRQVAAGLPGDRFVHRLRTVCPPDATTPSAHAADTNGPGPPPRPSEPPELSGTNSPCS